MKGPHPTPSVLKLLRGNPGRRPISAREPQPGALSPITPRDLVDEAARLEWRRTIVPAIATGQITAADRVLAVAHCDLWSAYRSQLAVAAVDGHLIVTGKAQYKIPNPARGMANKTLSLLVKVDAELGLSPSSRTRVRVSGGTGAEKNPLDRFVNKSKA